MSSFTALLLVSTRSGHLAESFVHSEHHSCSSEAGGSMLPFLSLSLGHAGSMGHGIILQFGMKAAK